ncbi:hypothetical protein [Hymenobacter lapidarius]|uniref:hypothetical protein n=1 Tax=Hymenobacter lapidarius TaxID=1908237 RepID=UPI0013015311|nr:hypothetical protein [Hymenobacter lapidarius]
MEYGLFQMERREKNTTESLCGGKPHPSAAKAVHQADGKGKTSIAAATHKN